MDILKVAHYIIKSNVENKEEYFSDKYPVFKQKYPVLYKKICTEPNFDIKNLEYMVGVLESNKNNHDQDVQVGQMLFDKYVKHMTDKPKE